MCLDSVYILSYKILAVYDWDLSRCSISDDHRWVDLRDISLLRLELDRQNIKWATIADIKWLECGKITTGIRTIYTIIILSMANKKNVGCRLSIIDVRCTRFYTVVKMNIQELRMNRRRMQTHSILSKFYEFQWIGVNSSIAFFFKYSFRFRYFLRCVWINTHIIHILKNGRKYLRPHWKRSIYR